MVCVCILCQEHPKAQPTVVLEKLGSNLRSLVYKACGLSTTPRRLPTYFKDSIKINWPYLCQI